MRCTLLAPFSWLFITTGSIAAACSSGLPAGPVANDPDGSSGDGAPTDGDGDGAAPSDGSDAGVATDGLPCEVRDLLGLYCVSCHGNPPVGGAHVPLIRVDDLRAVRGASTVGEQALERLRTSDQARMPPAGSRPSASEVDAFASWITAGMPGDGCSDGRDAGVPIEDPTFAGATVCTSGVEWLRGDEESELMHPGLACIDCHTTRDEGPRLSIAGTVYETGHEFDDCNGAAPSGVRVIIEDANGNELTLTPNQAGNFLSRSQMRFPVTARVVFQGRERAMVQPVDSGDCNSCHTERGSDGAPGRIALP